MAETGGVPPAVFGWIGAAIGLIGGPAAIAKAVKWWVARADRRRKDRAAGNREWEAKLKAREAAAEKRDHEFAQRLMDSEAACEAKCAELREDFARLRGDNEVLSLCLTIAVPKLQAIPGNASEIAMMRVVLRNRFPAESTPPAWAAELFRQLETPRGQS